MIIKSELRFSLKLSEAFLILRRIQRDTFVDLHISFIYLFIY
jgi:hypothetical protein